MSQRTFVGQRMSSSAGDFIVAVGIVHQLSKKSFQWEGFERPIVLSWPVNQQEWWKKRHEAFRHNFGKANKGRTTSMGMAQILVKNYCPIPKRARDLLPIDRADFRSGELKTASFNNLNPLDRMIVHGAAQHNLPLDDMFYKAVASTAAASLVAGRMLKK